MSDSIEDIRNTAKRFFDAVESGDAETAAEIYHPDVEIWRNTDRKTANREAALAGLRAFAARAPKRRYADRRVGVFDGGFVQQHVLIAEQPNGKVLELPCCVVCAVEGGRITRLDEYFDVRPLEAWFA